MKIHILLVALFIATSIRGLGQQAAMPGPHLLVYKTKKDYRKYVPVVLSADRKTIVSYPDPVDVSRMGTSMRATKLHKGYLMDNYGVGRNTAYLKLTITEYGALKQAPATGEMYKKIKEKNPLTILYDCGVKSNYRSAEQEVNKLIDNGKLAEKCKEMH